MPRYLAAAALSSLILIEPVAALDLGVGVKSGGVSLGASVGVGRKGASLGIGASLGGSTSVNAGASVGKDKAGVSASVTGGGKVGGISVGASVDGNSSSVSVGKSPTSKSGVSSVAGATPSGSKASKGSTSVSKSKDPGTAPAIARAVAAKGNFLSITLPRSLRPAGGRSGRASAVILEAIQGTPSPIVRSCRDAVKEAATEFGVVSVQAKSAGALRELTGGVISAPVQVRIRYSTLGGPEIRQARIKCQLDATGRVIKLT